jgi:hypothetical protein
VAARDNWKRLVLRCLPDVVAWLPVAVRLERSWQRRAEEEADLAAARADREVGAQLAGALVKLARWRVLAELPLASAFDAGGPLARRVRRLLHAPTPLQAACAPWTLLVAAVVLPAGLCAAFPALSTRVHLAVETLVQLLQG